MELLGILKDIPVPVLIAIAILLLAVNIVIVYQYLKTKGLEGIREDVYHLVLTAEHVFNESGTGKQKLKWVVQQARGLLPKWLQFVITEETLTKIIDKWFRAVKDLLDDGKVNSSNQ